MYIKEPEHKQIRNWKLSTLLQSSDSRKDKLHIWDSVPETKMRAQKTRKRPWWSDLNKEKRAKQIKKGGSEEPSKIQKGNSFSVVSGLLILKFSWSKLMFTSYQNRSWLIKAPTVCTGTVQKWNLESITTHCWNLEPGEESNLSKVENNTNGLWDEAMNLGAQLHEECHVSIDTPPQKADDD